MKKFGRYGTYNAGFTDNSGSNASDNGNENGNNFEIPPLFANMMGNMGGMFGGGQQGRQSNQNETPEEEYFDDGGYNPQHDTFGQPDQTKNVNAQSAAETKSAPLSRSAEQYVELMNRHKKFVRTVRK